MNDEDQVERSGSFKLAMAQMLVVGGEPEANLARAGAMISHSAAAGAAVALLPECVDFGWNHPSAKSRAGPIPDGQTCRFLCDAARHHRLYVCSGLVERQGDALYNSAVLVDPDGRIILYHRKLNEILPGHELYAQGDRFAGVAHTPLGTLGLMICADAFAEGQVIARTLGYMGADVILSPSAWAVPLDWDNVKTPYSAEWRPHYEPVARDFEMWIASVSNVGVFQSEGKELPCIGNSLVYDPHGREALCGPFGADAEALLFIDIEPRPRPTRACGWPIRWKEHGRAVADQTDRASRFFT